MPNSWCDHDILFVVEAVFISRHPINVCKSISVMNLTSIFDFGTYTCSYRSTRIHRYISPLHMQSLAINRIAVKVYLNNHIFVYAIHIITSYDCPSYLAALISS